MKRPLGSKAPPKIIGRRRSSGITFPCSFSLRANRVLVTHVMIHVITPMTTRIVTPRKGRAPTPRDHPRSSWKEIGYASKKKVNYTIYQRHVYSDEYKDWFQDKHLERAKQILDNNFTEVYLVFICWSMYSPLFVSNRVFFAFR